MLPSLDIVRLVPSIQGVFESDQEFEREVQRIADSLWPSDELGGPTNSGGRERDGLYVTEHVVNVLEATTSRRKDKAQQDIRKITDALQALRNRHQDRSLKGWFITREQPTADQLDVARGHRGLVVAESVDKFRARLIDASVYLRLRNQYEFGSAQDPETKSRTKLPEYLPLDALDRDTGAPWSVMAMVDAATQGTRFVLLGDFGAGKSMTMREVFTRLRAAFQSGSARRLPLHLNLRDHHGQDNPAEALERHGRNIGFPNPHHLVRAWRSGQADLLLDGFDELGSPGWMGSTKRMTAVRSAAVALVRNFVQQAQEGTAVLIAGRLHFFDSTQELRGALGLSTEYHLLSLNEFSEDQIEDYLRRRKIPGVVPEWLPGRPLLVSYLAAHGFLGDVLSTSFEDSAAQSWDRLIDRICEREATIDIHLDGPTVRLVIERLATLVRNTTDGLGPIAFDDLAEVFRDVCGYAPDDKGMVLLQRLPGLALRDQQLNSRQFVDEDLADAARAGDVCNFVMSPFTFERRDPTAWGIGLGDLGVGLVAARIEDGRIAPASCAVALTESQRRGWMMLAADVARSAVEAGVTLRGSERTFIREVDIPGLDLVDGDWDFSSLEFQDSVVRRLAIDRKLDPQKQPTFVRCIFGLVEGRVGPADLPASRFIECEFEEFAQSSSTTAGIMNLSIAPGARVALTVLKKLYLQRGSGRKEAALFRGLDSDSRRLVPDVLKLIEQHGLLTRGRSAQGVFYLPNRASGPRVRKMLAAPMSSGDPLITQCEDVL